MVAAEQSTLEAGGGVARSGADPRIDTLAVLLWLSLAVALAGPAGIAVWSGLQAESLLAAGFAATLVPCVAVLIAAGARRASLSSTLRICVSVAPVLAGFGYIIGLQTLGKSFGSPWTFGAICAAHVPFFAILWTVARTPSSFGKPGLPIVSVGASSIVLLCVEAAISFAGGANRLELAPDLLSAAYGLAVAPALLLNWAQARREGRLPRTKSDRQPDHISGMGASALIAFALLIVTLGLWATASGNTQKIDNATGSIVIFGLALSFLAVAFGPSLPVAGGVSALRAVLAALVKPLGKMFSWFDSFLVFPVAGALGATQTSDLRRYLLLLGNMAPCAILGWYLPAPYGLIPLGAALLGAIAVARRWAWIEEDRENAMLNRQYEGPHLRVGFGQDLKDETLVAFAALLFLVPLVLRQFHIALGGHVFDADAIATNDPIAWFSFFGTELAKALPFVDWAEVYHVEGNAPIKLADGVGMGNHIIFATRILVDLVLLAAFLQAISIWQRTRKLKDMFYVEQTLDQLDPFIEPAAFKRLVRSTAEGFVLVAEEVEKFPRYNEDRLEFLKQRGEADELGFVAAQLLLRYDAGGPEEQLLAQAKRPKPDREVCDDLIEQMRHAGPLNIGALKAAHFQLNGKKSFWLIRRAIAELISGQAEALGAINALSEILIGPGPGVADPRQEVRRAVLPGLYRPALEGNPVARDAIEWAAEKDTAGAVRADAQRLLNQIKNNGAPPV